MATRDPSSEWFFYSGGEQFGTYASRQAADAAQGPALLYRLDKDARKKIADDFKARFGSSHKVPRCGGG